MTTEERLAKVEGELAHVKRRSRWLLAAFGLGLGALALVWASAASVPKAGAQGAVGAGPKIIRANLFILEDENGKALALLGANKDGPSLTLCDTAGAPRVLLGVNKDGPGLTLHDGAGKMIWAAGGADSVVATPRKVTPPVKAAPPAALPESRICPDCNGTGYELIAPSGGKRCKSCGGTGKITSPPQRETLEEQEAAQRALEGRPAPQWRPCPACNGSGIDTSRGPCFTCEGTGRYGPFACPSCKCRGYPPCSRCDGKGMVSD